MTSIRTKVGHGLARGLGIKLNYRNEMNDPVTRGESTFSVSSADTYVEREPTAGEFLREVAPTGQSIGRYFYSLFPFLRWITRYNLQWFAGDLVAGITVGAVVVPQSMAYAKLAQLPVEYGLYSSFMGVLIYWFFATSKDITIGPVAVMSTVVGNIVIRAQEKLPDIDGPTIANAHAVIAGAIVLFLGFIRFGFLVEFISLVAISAFMTGSAISIAVGQVPALMGISNVNNRAAPYKVIINTLKGLPRTKVDAAMGLTALTMLYLIRFTCSFMAKKRPDKQKMFFFISTLRTAFVILLYTAISAGVNINHKDDSKKARFSILGSVPRGFQHASVPMINVPIIESFLGELPASVIVLLIEHISISKSFGRINNYTIDPSQEMVAIGVTNVLGPFLGAYAATGSFSRTAIKSKAGVRTPFAGVITALVVLLAIYALPAVFYFIPNSSLAAVIIHAVGDLITPPNVVYQFWRVSPLETPIFFIGVIVMIFSNIENGIYVTMALSLALFLFRSLKARGRFLGRVKVHSVIGDHVLDGDNKESRESAKQPLFKSDPDNAARNIFLPLSHEDGSNPTIEIETPYPGVFIYRFSEGFNYPNANHYLDNLTQTIFRQTRRTNPTTYGKLGDRPWNDPGPRKGKEVDTTDSLPTLKAIILDFSSVNNCDVTSIQNLIDVRNQLDRYAAPDTVDWHFAFINNRWTKRSLVAAGFGYPTPKADPETGPNRWKPIFSVAELGGSDSAAAAAEALEKRRAARVNGRVDDIEADTRSSDTDSLHNTLSHSKAYGTAGVTSSSRVAVVQGLNRPLFHIDLTSALLSAVANIENKQH